MLTRTAFFCYQALSYHSQRADMPLTGLQHLRVKGVCDSSAGIVSQPILDRQDRSLLLHEGCWVCRTPFKLHRAPLEELDMSVGSLGTRLRAMSLGAESGQQAPDKSDGKLEKAADAPMQRGPVLVILDERLQSLPWESLPALRSQRCEESLKRCF